MIAVQLNKLLFLTMLITGSAYAIEPVLLLSKLQFEKSLKNYEDKISLCSKNADKSISLSALKPLKFSREDWITILIHLQRKTFDACVYKEKADFALRVNSYIAVSKHFKTDYSDIKHYEGSTPFGYVYNDLAYEIKYLQINKNMRDYLSKLSVFKNNFDPVLTLENIEKSDLLIK